VLKECNDVETSMVVGQIQYANIWFSCAPRARPATSWPATPGLGRKGRWRAVTTRGLNWSSTFQNYTHSEPRFNALLTEDGPERLELAGA
jgi:hypothetical protein